MSALHVAVDDFADPWEQHETVVLVHGFAESGQAWFAWIPHLSRHYRVVRPDLLGFGDSPVPPAPAERRWTVHELADGVTGALDRLGVERAHVIGARVGCAVGVVLAVAQPERVQTLALVSGIARGAHVNGLRSDGAQIPLADFAARIREHGVAGWFARTGRSRLGSAAPEAQVRWWSELMARSNAGACVGMMRAAAELDIIDLLPQVQAPTLVLAARESAVQDIDATRAWQRLIPGSRLEVLAGDSPHLAATHPDDCARRVLRFIAQSR